MQNYKIPRTEILKLYESCLNEVLAHSISQWLKVVTDGEYTVASRSLLEKINECAKNLDHYW
jgi:hypothetical protein